MEEVPSLPISLDDILEGLVLNLDATKDESLRDAGLDAVEHGEARYQLKEGFTYEYEFNSKEVEFGEIDEKNIIQPRKKDSSLGLISPNIFVGTLRLPIRTKSDGKILGQLPLEVRSAKTGYRDDYRTMMEHITAKCVDLVLQAESVVSQNLTHDFDNDARDEVLYQRFMFVKSVVDSEEFEEAVQRVLSAPVTRWAETEEEKDVRQAGRLTSSNIRQMMKGVRRIPIPEGHPLRSVGFDSIPDRISVTRKTDSVDTPENRFVRHALEAFLKFCEDVEHAPNAGLVTRTEARRLAEHIEGWLQHDVFRSLSRATLLKLNSPVLQRKSGYREVLHAWLLFDLARKLVWTGGEDVYSAGKKDVATLYEYWLFFQLLDLLKSMYQIEPEELDQLIQPSNDGMTLSLKQGNSVALEGITEKNGRKLKIRFSYNRSFAGKSEYPDSGSWTSTLRPDYTLSIWPFGITEKQAEIEELIVHVHFDAKYKVENYQRMIASSEDEGVLEKTENRKGVYKNADLLKMHAYKDAIRRTGGAYVLYPGTEKVQRGGFHEIVPGLGAFPIRPSKDDSGIQHLKQFLESLTDHFVNRTSQREKLAYRTYDIHRDRPSNDVTIREPLPETYGDNRSLIPDETYVLVGYYKDAAHREWIRRNRLYNFRTGDGPGSLPLGYAEVSAKYLLLYTGDALCSDLLLKIQGQGPRVYGKAEMEKLNYVSDEIRHQYLVIEIDTYIEPELRGKKWDLSKLKNYSPDVPKGVPFTTTLAELVLFGV